MRSSKKGLPTSPWLTPRLAILVFTGLAACGGGDPVDRTSASSNDLTLGNGEKADAGGGEGCLPGEGQDCTADPNSCAPGLSCQGMATDGSNGWLGGFCARKDHVQCLVHRAYYSVECYLACDLGYGDVCGDWRYNPREHGEHGACDAAKGLSCLDSTGYGAQYYFCGCGVGLHYDATAGKCAPDGADAG